VRRRAKSRDEIENRLVFAGGRARLGLRVFDELL